jgi:hypothetical protein
MMCHAGPKNRKSCAINKLPALININKTPEDEEKSAYRPVFIARENRKNSLCARFLLFLLFAGWQKGKRRRQRRA